jgi:uncharacterized protein YjiS (DUF1127 family)
MSHIVAAMKPPGLPAGPLNGDNTMHAQAKPLSLITSLQASLWWAGERLIYRASRQWSAWREARAAAQRLADAEALLTALNDHELRDLGLTRDQIPAAVRGQVKRTR